MTQDTPLSFHPSSEQNETVASASPVLDPKLALIESELQLRHLAKMTQSQLAQRMGTTQANISLFERGEYNPTIAFLTKMAVALGKDLNIEFK